MPELILLCAAAALDREPGADAQLDATGVRGALARGAFARGFRRARCVVERHDPALVPRELPQDAWWRARASVPEGDAIEAYAALAHGLRPPLWRLTPAHVQIGLDHARLTDPAALALRAQESAELARAAAPLLAEHGLELHAPSPSAWFALARTQLDLTTHAWTMAAGRNVDAYLPAGPDARRWRRMLTEVQMTWFEHPVNRARESRGEPAVNMLWIDGCVAGAPTGAPVRVISDDPALAGLAHATGGEAIAAGGELPDAAELRALARHGDLVVDVGGWSDARRRGEPQPWHDAWLRFDRWLARAGLAGGAHPQFDAIRVVLTGERRHLELVAGRRDAWRVWRRIDPLGLAL